MSNEPNYRTLTPPSDKPRTEYSWAERRAVIYELIDQAGHYRNIERSTRDLGNQFGVSHTTIRKDIQAVNEWKAKHLGDTAEAELETLKNKAVQELLERGEEAAAYKLMNQHYRTLMDTAAAGQDRTPDKTEVSGEGGGALNIVINDSIREVEDERDE